MESNTTASNSFSWKDLNWELLRSLRARFLSFENSSGQAADYWQSVEELACYDLTFAERIGWKWNAVLAELQARGWTPPAGTMLDFGCGTGVAGRRVASAWPDRITRLELWDRSAAAIQFARNRAKALFPRLAVEPFKEGEAVPILVVSHVLNELSPGALERLLSLASKAQVVLWVEPGTAAASHALVGVRQRLVLLRAAKEDAGGLPLRPVAPCPHALSCGMLSPGNERHWCHHFAKVPSAVFQDPDWSRFARMVEVDLGTVPFSYLVLDRRPMEEQSGGKVVRSGNARLIGHPRCYKGFHKVLACRAEGVGELILQKRDVLELYKEMKKDPGSLYQWACQQEKITGSERIY